MRQRYAIEDGRLREREDGSQVLVFVAPAREERQALSEEYGLDPHDVNSALDPDELGRVEIGKDSAMMILKRPRNFTSPDQLLFTVTSMGLFLDRKRLVIVTTDEADLFEDRVIHKVANPRDALLKVLYGTIAHFLGHLKVINMLSDALERRINTSMENRYLLDMFTLEKSLVYFVNGIASNEMVLEKMRNQAKGLKLTAPQTAVLDDIIIENQQCSKQAEIYSNILTGLMDARGSVVNNNLSVLMKRLTIISIVFMPMNVLVGMGGMSEFSSWTANLPWWLGYGLFVVGLVPMGFFTYWVLRLTERDVASRRAALEDARGKRARERARRRQDKALDKVARA